MSYIEGFVAAVPRANRESYRQFAEKAVPHFKRLGATRLVENWGDDVPDGKVTDFKGAVKAKDDEVVVFSWIEWPDKATRDTGMQKAMEDPRMNFNMDNVPFDGKRMIFGGFQVIVSA